MEWYAGNKRDLPWRADRDPYKIWLSEIILQQTRIAQGMPYYQQFLEKFPSLDHLARAKEEEILRLWQGLGYYSRATNMLFCAKTLQSEYGGDFPRSFDELCKLKGIGGYTAAAIASIAFGQKAAVVDGNVQRVLSRVFGVFDDVASSAGKKTLQRLADELIPEQHPGDYNQAVMEFGALQCVPKNPDCSSCVLSAGCHAFVNHQQEVLPVKSKKKAPRNRYFHYFVIGDGDQFLMRKRNQGGIWKGLWEFMVMESALKEETDNITAKIRALYGADLTIDFRSEVYRRPLTHQQIFARFYIVSAYSGPLCRMISDNELHWVSRQKMHELPKPVLIYNFLNAGFF